MSALPQMSDTKELDDDALPQLKELVNPHWTNRQHAFARQLRSDPTPAMRSLHQLWKRNKLTGSFSPECELARLLSVLAEGFVDPQGKGARRMISTVDSLGNELWKACIHTEFLLLLIDIIAHCELHTQPRSIFLTLLECINGFMMIWMMAAIELPAGLDFIAPELAKLAPKVPVPDAQGQTFLERSDEVCDAIWKAREYIICDSDGIEPDQEYVLSQMDRFVLSMDGLPKKSHGQNGWRHQKLAYLAMLTWTLRHPTSDSPKPGSFQDPTQAAMVSFVSVYGSVAKHLANVEQVVGFLADIVLKVGYDKIARRIREALDAAVHTLDPSAQGLDNILIVARIITFPKDDYPAIWNSYCQNPLLNNVARALRVDAQRRRAEIAKKQNRDRDLNDWHIAARQWE
ncbi:hypothetical protein PENSPDRAFT_491674 [Peniophora sp. CONT]|nr:hypothetical protein PENSPDRAFT_491674 [Peniophora sp. CONT]